MENENQWNLIENGVPSKDGTYLCLVNRDGDLKEMKKAFKKGHWFGGCRPFSDNDVVTKWKKV